MRGAALRAVPGLAFPGTWPAGLTAGVACTGLVAAAAAEAGHSWGKETGRYQALAAAAFLAYALGLLLVRRAPPRPAHVLALAAVIQLAPLAQPLLLSRDAGAYWDYGRIAAIDAGNPYRDPPSRFAGDPAYRGVAGGWRDRTSTYGPLFTLVSEGSALAVGDSATWAARFFKILAALSVLAAAGLAATLSSRPALAAAAVGWSPLFAIHFAGGGHNDALAVAILLGALVLERRGRPQLAGALWACAAAVKWIPLLLLPVRCARRQPRFGYVGFAVAGAALALVASLRYGPAWLGALGPLVRNAEQGSSAALVPVAAVGVALFALAYLGLLRQAWRGRVRLGLTAVALLVTTPWLLPWYAIWALPLAAAEDDSTALLVSVVLTGYLLVPAAWI